MINPCNKIHMKTSNFTSFIICKLIFPAILFMCFTEPVWGHELDELGIRTTISPESEQILFEIDMAAGMMISSIYLDMLDPDRNTLFEEEDIRVFGEFLRENLSVTLNGETVALTLLSWEISPFKEFAAGVPTITMTFTLPFSLLDGEEAVLSYQNSVEASFATYSLKIADVEDFGITITEQKRNEFLQDSVTVLLAREEMNPEMLLKNDPKQPFDARPTPSSALAGEPEDQKNPLKRANEFLDAVYTGQIDQKAGIILVFFVLVAGFLHAFTPGHGKALVGAYMAANKGTVFHAVFVGLIVTFSHTISIYLFGALASTATYFFLPARVIPVTTVVAGLLIIFLGLRGLLQRFLGRAVDHAHLLPNLKILKQGNVNIVIENAPENVVELLNIESDDDELETQLHAVGAEGFNLCSPGCKSHSGTPGWLAEKQSLQLVKAALETGAVDGVVCTGDKRLEKIKSFTANRSPALFLMPGSKEEAKKILRGSLNGFTHRGDIVIPEESLSWKKLFTLAIAGGIVPCPDALAILLAAISLGHILLGMGIVLFFSIGLSVALIAIGVVIVLTKKILSGQGWFAGISRAIPYVSSAYITGLGIYMIVKLVI